MSNIALMKKDTVDVVTQKVREFENKGELHFPAGYSAENALKSAWLILQSTQDRTFKPALEVCTKDSVANALLDMVVQGLNPAKNQGYFIVYGNKLVFQRSYFGTMAVTKRVTGAKLIDATVIYADDQVDYEIINGRISNLVHKQKFGNIDKAKIAGAYCVITLPDGEKHVELMTYDEIVQAWRQSKMWGKDQKEAKVGSTHDKFAQEMAKKTIINRACKKLMNASDDSSLVMHHFQRATEVTSEAIVEAEIIENANQELLDIKQETPPNEFDFEADESFEKTIPEIKKQVDPGF